MKTPETIGEQSLAQLATDVRRSVTALARRLREKQPAGALTPARLSVLRLLTEHGSQSAGAIATAEFLQPQSVTRNLDVLEQQGLIERSVDPADRRRSLFAITTSGRAVVRREAGHRDAWLMQAISQHLNAAEQTALKKAVVALERLAEQD